MGIFMSILLMSKLSYARTKNKFHIALWKTSSWNTFFKMYSQKARVEMLYCPRNRTTSFSRVTKKLQSKHGDKRRKMKKMEENHPRSKQNIFLRWSAPETCVFFPDISNIFLLFTYFRTHLLFSETFNILGICLYFHKNNNNNRKEGKYILL